MLNKEKMRWLILLSMFLFLFVSCLSSKKSNNSPPSSTESVRNDDNQTVTTEMNSVPKDNKIEVFFTEAEQHAKNGSVFVSDIAINTGKEKIAAYSFTVIFPDDLIEIDTKGGNNGAEPGNDGFLAAVNPNFPGVFKVSGFDVNGKGPKAKLDLLAIHWLAKKKGTGKIILQVDSLANEKAMKLDAVDNVEAQITVN